MTKKKKKQTPINYSKFKAEERSKFYENIKRLCELLVGPAVYELIPDEALSEMFEERLYNYKLQPAPGVVIPPKELKNLNQVFLKIFETAHMAAGENKIPLLLYLKEGFCLIDFIYKAKAHEFDTAAQLKIIFKPFDPYSAFYEQAYNLFTNGLLHFGILASNFNTGVIYAEHILEPGENEQAVFNIIKIYKKDLEQSEVAINGKTRTIWKLGWGFPDGKFQHLSKKPSEIGYDNNVIDLPMDVYVQGHALIRLEERLGITPGIMHYLLYEAINHPKAIKHEDKILIEYLLSTVKAGYLLISINDGKIIIRTFLFLTNSGTPEGRKLEKMTGLAMADKKYLQIDQLSTLNAMNIGNDEVLKDLFTKVGCASLLKLGNVKDFSSNPDKFIDSAIVRNYLFK